MEAPYGRAIEEPPASCVHHACRRRRTHRHRHRISKSVHVSLRPLGLSLQFVITRVLVLSRLCHYPCGCNFVPGKLARFRYACVYQTKVM